MKSKVWLALLAIYIVWGSTYLAIRFAVESIPPFFAAGLRFLVAASILYPWRRLSGDPAPRIRQWRSAAIVGLLLLLGGNGLVSWSERRVPSGIAALIIGTVPLWLTLLESLRPGGTRLRLRVGLGLVMGFGGIVLLVGPSGLGSAGRLQFDALGLGALLLAALLWSIGSIYSKTADMPESTVLGTGMEMFAGGLGLIAVSGLSGEWAELSFAAITTRSWLGLAYLITAGSLIGFVAYAWLLRNAPVSLVSTYAYVNPVVAIFLGSALAHEVLNARTLIAAAVIVGAVVLIKSSKGPEPDAAMTAPAEKT